MTTDDPKEQSQKYERRLDVHGPEAAFNEDGVDLTQIRESLARTPLERLELVQNWVNSLDQVRVVRGPR
jgi:hypothetical protein